MTHETGILVNMVFLQAMSRVAGHRRGAAVLILTGAIFSTGCVDSATRLRFSVEKQASRLGLDGGEVEIAVPYEPVRDNQRPYWLVFLPHRHTKVSDLVAAGLDEEVAIRLFQDLSYVEFGDKGGPNLVVWQDGRRLNFTGTRRPRAERILVARRQGRCEIILRRRAAEWYIVTVR